MRGSSNQSPFSDRIIGNVKPLLLFIASIVAFIISIKNGCNQRQKSFSQYTINQLSDAGNDEIEISGFYIHQSLLAGQEKGGVALYATAQDTVPKAILIVTDMDDFIKTHKEKGKVIAKQFHGGVTANTDTGVKEFINGPGLKNQSNEYKIIFSYVPYATWKNMLWVYIFFPVMIIFLGIILLSRMRVY